MRQITQSYSQKIDLPICWRLRELRNSITATQDWNCYTVQDPRIHTLANMQTNVHTSVRTISISNKLISKYVGELTTFSIIGLQAKRGSRYGRVTDRKMWKTRQKIWGTVCDWNFIVIWCLQIIRGSKTGKIIIFCWILLVFSPLIRPLLPDYTPVYPIPLWFVQAL